METRKCPVCAENIPADVAFCPLCGEQLPDDELVTRKCPACAEDIPADATFCPLCGEQLPDDELVTRKCPACAEDIPSDATFCPLCGERLSDSEAASDAARSTISADRQQSVVPQSSARQSVGGGGGGKFRMSPLAIMAVAIVVIAVGGYFIFGSSKKSDDQPATDWNKLAISYLAANSIDEYDAYICDDERHCVYYLEEENYEGGNNSRIVKYDLQSRLKRTVSDWEDTPVMSDGIIEWGVLDDDRTIWVLSMSMPQTQGLCTYDTISDTWIDICSTSGNIEFLGEFIKCSRHGLVRSYGDTMVDADYAFMVKYYDWNGNEVEPYTYVGTIGSYPVVGELVFGGDKVCGSYYYLRYGPENRMELDGSITADNRMSLYGHAYDSCYQGDRHLVETIHCYWKGDDIEGTWTNTSNGNTLKVHLSLQ